MAMNPIPSSLACCLDPSHSALTRDGYNCAHEPHCGYVLNRCSNSQLQDSFPVQSSSARLFSSQSEVYHSWPALPYSDETSGIPLMAGIANSNGIVDAGRVASSQSTVQMDEPDMQPFDLSTYRRGEGVRNQHSSSSLSGQPMPDFTELPGKTHASIAVPGHVQQVHGVLHQEQILSVHTTNKELSMPMPIPLATQARVTCLWPGCEEHFLPILNSVVAHFRTHSAAGNKRCFWPGCVSTPKDLSQHVLDSHCNLRWICPQCFRSDFEAKRSVTRHLRESCKGQRVDTAAICAHCGICWKNQADMARHAPYCVHAWAYNTNTGAI